MRSFVEQLLAFSGRASLTVMILSAAAGAVH
jgi:hypothetical protein